MTTFSHTIHRIAGFLLLTAALADEAYANQLVYVPLAQPCRLLDTRVSSKGPGPLTAAHGPYLFGTSAADISIIAQNGKSTGCSIPDGIEAVSVNMNMLDATAAGNIATWSADVGPNAPNIGTGVYNPSMANPVAGEVLYNTGYSTIPVGGMDTTGNAGPNTGKFYLQIANGQADMTINVVGYWLAVSWGETRRNGGVNPGSIALGFNTTVGGYYSTALGAYTTAAGQNSTAMGSETYANNDYATALGVRSVANGSAATAMGDHTRASGFSSTAMGFETIASGTTSTAMGHQTQAAKENSTAMGYATLADGNNSTAMGNNTAATGDSSTAMGYGTKAIGNYATAMGFNTVADAEFSTAMGYNATVKGHVGSFIYADRAHAGMIENTQDNQFKVVANGGTVFKSEGRGVVFDVPDFTFNTSGGIITSTRYDMAHGSGAVTGVRLLPGDGTWTSVSDRNAKTALQPVDPREVLKKVVALPMSTWQYKTQEKFRHLGPMAQDFYAAFHLGGSDTGIATIDADGVALAAIQGLNALLTEKDGQLTALRDEKDREIGELRAELAAQKTESTAQKTEIVMQKARIASLESLAGDLAEVKAQVATLRKSVPTELTTVALREQ